MYPCDVSDLMRETLCAESEGERVRERERGMAS